eukprot:TRINITY_DN15421_c0_g1_i1.p1 TRINITY_DN15421_c0_g1~~TRINITY_DN15421_c0_g1_i1.p1  ORF type:complete len:228 (+),score=33.80 TRINITY_DN15421_c0_g1_i1:533-1216(+)
MKTLFIGLSLLALVAVSLAQTRSCSTYTNCNTCTDYANGGGGSCGWCIGAGICQSRFTDCPNTIKSPSTSCPPAGCTSYTNCTQCTNARSATGTFCAWCSSDRHCYASGYTPETCTFSYTSPSFCDGKVAEGLAQWIIAVIVISILVFFAIIATIIGVCCCACCACCACCPRYVEPGGTYVQVVSTGAQPQPQMYAQQYQQTTYSYQPPQPAAVGFAPAQYGQPVYQ